MSFASELHGLVGGSGLGVAGTARLVPCDKGYISRLANGRQRPSRQIAWRLDEIFGCSGALAAAAGFTRPGLPSLDAGARTALAVQGLRDALLDYGYLGQASGTEAGHASPVAVLERKVAGLLAAYQGSRYTVVLAELPGLLGECQVAAEARRGPARRRALGLVALCHQAAALILPKLGDATLAWVAAERGLQSARESGDPVVIASLLRSVAYVHQCCGRYETALHVTETAAGFMRARLDLTSPAGLSLYGTAFLAGAMAAARSGDKAAVRDLLAQAARAAEKLGGERNYLWTAFGPSNVLIHQVATAVELDSMQAAVRLASRVRLDRLVPERRARHAFDVARAYTAWGRPDEALAVLLEAERLVPEQVRGHAAGRQAAAALIEASGARPGAELVAFARRAGVPDMPVA
jgi:tetratricopeptide (TPR) repeat protein